MSEPKFKIGDKVWVNLYGIIASSFSITSTATDKIPYMYTLGGLSGWWPESVLQEAEPFNEKQKLAELLSGLFIQPTSLASTDTAWNNALMSVAKAMGLRKVLGAVKFEP